MKSQHTKLLRTVATYAALALGVTVGGVVIGGVVVAPAVSRVAPARSVRAVEVGLPKADESNTAAMIPGAATANVASVVSTPPTTRYSRFIKRAAIFRRDMKSLPLMRSMPEFGWLLIGVAAAVTLSLMIGWRLRTGPGMPASAELAQRATASLPVKLVAGRNSKTPRAVLALAEAGTAPGEIARRTGLSLDAVVMCLSLTSFTARQLRPPTA